MTEIDFKKEYEKIKTKYKELPDFDVINFEFEISSIEKDGFILRRIIERITEELEYLIGLIDDILQPDTNSFAALYECDCFGSEEKKEILDLFKRLMVYNREAIELIIEMDDKKTVDYICRIIKEWKELRKQSAKYIKKLKQSWQETKEYKEILQYLG